MKRLLTIIISLVLIGYSLVSANAAPTGTNIGQALLSKVVVTGVSQSSTNPRDIINVTVSLQNLNLTALNGVMVSVGSLSSQTLSLTNNFGPFKVDLDAMVNDSATPSGSGAQNDTPKNIKKISFDLIANQNIQKGNYPLTLTLTYVDDNGVTVSADRSFSIQIDSATGTKVTTPLAIVSSYTVGKDKINAGDTFDLTFTLQNTSKTQDLTNMLVSLSSESNAFTPMVGATNQFYIGSIAAGGNYTVKAKLLANNTLLSGAYNLKIDMQYQDYEKNSFNSSSAISISLNAPVKTAVAVEVPTPQVVVTSYNITSQHIFGGDNFELSFTLKNTSSATANNVLISFSSESNAFVPGTGTPNQISAGKITSGSTFSGKIGLRANDILKSGIYTLHISLQYLGTNYQYQTGNGAPPVNGTASTYSSATDISLKIEQPEKMTIKNVTVPETAILGFQTRLSINYENPGATDIKNVIVNLSGDIPDKEKSVQVGGVKAGASGYVEQYITPQKAGQLPLGIILTFQDSNGNSYTTETKSATITVKANDSTQTTPGATSKPRWQYNDWIADSEAKT